MLEPEVTAEAKHDQEADTSNTPFVCKNIANHFIPPNLLCAHIVFAF